MFDRRCSGTKYLRPLRLAVQALAMTVGALGLGDAKA